MRQLVQAPGNGLYRPSDLSMHRARVFFRVSLSLAVALGSLLATSCESSVPTYLTHPGLGGASGTVLDKSGRPLSAFTAKAWGILEGTELDLVVVGQDRVADSKDGSFIINGIPAGSFVVQVISPEYAPSVCGPFVSVTGHVTGGIHLVMTQGGSLAGKVVDAYQNKPIVGAEVGTMERICGKNGQFLGATIERLTSIQGKVHTDEKGEFFMKLLTPETYSIQIRAEGFAKGFVPEIVIYDGENTRLPMQMLVRGALLEGKVYGNRNTSCSNALVSLHPLNGAPWDYQMRSDANGRYRIENAPPGRYRLWAGREHQGNLQVVLDMRRSEKDVWLEDGQRYELDLHVEDE